MFLNRPNSRVCALLGASLFALILLVSCGRPAMLPGTPERGFIVYGYVTTGEENRALVGETVYLFDDERNEPIATIKTDSFGKFAFAYHPPARYRVEVGELASTVEITTEDAQLDLHVP